MPKKMFTLQHFFVFLLLLLCCPPPARTSHNSTLSDQHALLAFRNSLDLESRHSLHDWNANHSLCTWRGVVCSSGPNRPLRVVSLNLTGMALVGPISPFLGNLSFLRVLDLGNNSFHGQIPYELGRLFRLRILRLSYNSLSGSIPSEIGRLPSMEKVMLGKNQLTGTIPMFVSSTLSLLDIRQNMLHGAIPSHLALLVNLELLGLGKNQLSGKIPSFVGNMSYLTTIDLQRNRLHGPIPLELASLHQLAILDLSENSFTGEIPAALSNCSYLKILDLNTNHFSGHIPWEFGTKLPQLQEMYLGINHLEGEIPISLFNCSQLQKLDLSCNKLSGTVPMELGKLFRLRSLNLMSNKLVSGSSTILLVLASLTNCSHLEELYMAQNLLTGFLPSSIGQLSTELLHLELHTNEIQGNIPDDIGNLTKLTTLDLGLNSFSGTIPSTLNRLSTLEKLYIDDNNLHGSIPNSLGQIKTLGLLDLSNNMLSGPIPNTLGQLPQLRELHLYRNQLSGQIPADLGRCLTLQRLDLAYNKLSGNIPSEVAGLPNLAFYFNVSNNLIQGSLPLEISRMAMVQAIDLSRNNLSGGILSELESCMALQYLNLSWNTLEGPIPASLANLKNLQDMDISSNKLNGTIPVALQELKLQHLNMSSNKLIGEVPKHGIFAQLDITAVKGNLGLCGTVIGLPVCSHSKHNQLWLLLKVIIPIVIGIATFTICFLFLQFIKRCKSPRIEDFKIEPTKISYEELANATRGFNEANLLGIGSFGSVYRGTLNNNTNIAIKVLNLQAENAHRSFRRECDVLIGIRHRNVIRIITTYSSNDFKAIIFPFMPNGSLERLLYPDGEDECTLTLRDRLRIAMEVAQGLEYLHHHCFVQVVHCDLKPNNVLLGDDLTAYVADFGISKLVSGNSSGLLASTNALRGSIGYMAPGTRYTFRVIVINISFLFCSLSIYNLDHSIILQNMEQVERFGQMEMYTAMAFYC